MNAIQETETDDPDGIYDCTVTAADGHPVSMRDYAGQVLLIVNTASRCGFTPQYAGLEELYRRYADRGFTVLAFPCDQFAHQEPGDAEEIARFCSLNYDVTFPVMAKVDVNGPNADRVFKRVKSAARGLFGSRGIKWNFTKFLVSRSGLLVRRFGPTTRPEQMAQAIERQLSR